MLFHVVVLIIGIMMIVQHNAHGWMKPPVLSGVAFVLIALPSVLSMLGL